MTEISSHHASEINVDNKEKAKLEIESNAFEAQEKASRFEKEAKVSSHNGNASLLFFE